MGREGLEGQFDKEVEVTAKYEHIHLWKPLYSLVRLFSQKWKHPLRRIIKFTARKWHLTLLFTLHSAPISHIQRGSDVCMSEQTGADPNSTPTFSKSTKILKNVVIALFLKVTKTSPWNYNESPHEEFFSSSFKLSVLWTKHAAERCWCCVR